MEHLHERSSDMGMILPLIWVRGFTIIKARKRIEGEKIAPFEKYKLLK